MKVAGVAGELEAVVGVGRGERAIGKGLDHARSCGDLEGRGFNFSSLPVLLFQIYLMMGS